MSNVSDPFADNRVILVHKQATSARTRFLSFAYGGVCAFSALPTLATMQEGVTGSGEIVPLSRAVVAQVAQKLEIAGSDLVSEDEFAERVETPDGDIHIHLASFTTIDPPFDLAERLGGKFIDITEARRVPPLELQLLRRAYQVMVG